MFSAGELSAHKTHEMSLRRSTRVRKATPKNAFDLLTENFRRCKKREKTKFSRKKDARQKRKNVWSKTISNTKRKRWSFENPDGLGTKDFIRKFGNTMLRSE